MNKVEQSINALSKTEKRAFRQFLCSPFFNQRPELILLYDYMLGQSLSDKEQAFAFCLPGEAYKNQKFRLLMSELQQQAAHFMAYTQWENQLGAAQGDLLKAYRKRGLEQHFQDALKSARQSLDQQALRNTDYFERLEEALWEEAHYAAVNTPHEVQQLAQLYELADTVWLGKKLRYLCLYRAQQIRYPSSQQLQLREEVEAAFKRFPVADIPAVSIWYNCLKMLEAEEASSYFMTFKNLLLTQDALFNADEIRDLYFFALNYCIRRVNEGQKKYFTDIMDFYKDGLQKSHLLENGVLSRFTYHNIVAAGLQTREYEWVDHFIHQYKNHLERSHRDSSFSFNLARLAFSRKRYDEALSLLQHAHYYDLLLNLAAKTMLLKIYYETGAFDLLDSHVEALKIYIRRKTTLGYHRTNYLNLVRYTQKLIALNRLNKKDVDALRQKIKAEAVLTEREWLLEQVETAV